ncbi:MAG: DUF2225 domain-containing protein [Clostridia bacterium]|nr:DUF2225 domain-containing protein [Clostridia bacterium]
MVISSCFVQEKTCPICQTKFKVTRIRSSAYSVLKRDTDFNVTYNGINPTLYTVWVCYQCNFAAPDRNFEEILRPAELDRLTKGLPLLKSEEPDFGGERTPQVGLRAYELAIRTAQIRSAGAGFQASLFLKAAWMCRELGNDVLEREYLDQARQLYEKSYNNETGGAGKLSEAGLLYLIGELNRRIGNYNEAIHWFSRAVANPSIKKEAEINRLAREQWGLAREEAKEQPHNDENLPPKGSLENQPAERIENSPGSEVSAAVKPAVKRQRFKNKMFTSLYTDQIEWLQGVANRCHSEKKAFVEREAVIRAALDAIMEICPEISAASSEEELKDNIVSVLKG